ncbi:type II toxin-antitoxin system RelE/ParE family toxin [Sphingobacterium mizutaii]|uniref:type II toxin-antitoxin system RelE/ParE family toxin n=1 Tax=Sphingobacterium mizutaii TaxID=1010 RepID=UPI0028A1F622|nr:type II toxin-antitoxin system RelE/ParE family toxin [Sphingobacterium mizutaii]
MYYIEKTIEFDKWLKKLKDLTGKAKILIRIQKIEKEGHFGDCKQVGEGVNELRINHANGYRVYFTEHKDKIILLLLGGNKTSQNQDIKKAKLILKNLSKNKKH